MLPHLEADGEDAFHGTLEAHAEEQTPVRVPTARGKQRPAAGGLNGSVVLDDAREVKDITPSPRVDVHRHGQTVIGIAVEHGRRVARKSIARELLKALLEALGRQCGQVFEDEVHGSAASTRRAGRLAS